MYNPKGYSGTLEKANAHFKAQSILADYNLSPKPIEECKIKIVLVHSIPVIERLECYGMKMERVLSGGLSCILKTLRLFGVEETAEVQTVMTKWFGWQGLDALTLNDYIIVCRYFGVSGKEYLEEIIGDLKSRMPSAFASAPDFLTPTNVCLDEKGEAKVVDCDLSGL